MEYVFQTSGLTKTFAGKRAVSNVSMNVCRGDIYGFIGKNGAGKTTLIRIAVGLAAPTAGSVQLFGSNDLVKQRRRIGTVIEYPAVYPHMTARENLAVQCRLLGIADPSVIDSTLEAVGLIGTGKKKAKNFSLGMKQRLAIAIALIGDPELLFLDEPINGLDPTGIKEVRELIQKLNRERGITIVISSHILGELSKLATRYGIIDDGALVDEFTEEQLEERCKSCLRVRVDNTEKACGILEQTLQTQNYKLTDGGILLYDHVNEAGKLNTALVSGGVTVEELFPVNSDLENYFIHAVGGEEE